MGRKKSERYEAGRFGIVLSILLMVFSAFSWWRGHPQRALFLCLTAVMALLLTLAVRPLWIRFFRIWMRIVSVIGRIVTLVLLTAFFFLILTPYAWILRLAGRRGLDLGWKSERSTCWVEKTAAEPTAERYRRPF